MLENSIYVIDFGSQYTQLIARQVREAGVYCEVVSASTPASTLLTAKGIILSGSPDSVKFEASLDQAILQGKIPVLGICFGFHVICKLFGGEVASGKDGGEFGSAKVSLQAPSELFNSIPESFTAWMSHNDRVSNTGSRVTILASSANDLVAALAVKDKDIYAVQFHPEVSHTEYGKQILQNFIIGICGCKPDWKIENIIQKKQQQIYKQVGKDKVLLGLSGGVDSSVVAALLDSVIGKQLHAVFVDTGLLRKNEVAQVKKTFGEHFSINLEIVDAADKFYSGLKGVTDPEEKRKIIGKLFIDEFEKIALQHSDCKWLAQGTIYPDVIESSDPKSSEKTKVIKSHHNVGGLPEYLKLQLLEPLRDLFKDEVRMFGEALGLPKKLVWRQPFPGPGLAVRVLGEVKREYVEILRKADAIYMDILQQSGMMEQISQAFAVFIPVKTVGVKGDYRAYEYIIALRAVATDNFMTATAVKIDHNILSEIATQIVNRVAGVTRVCYDITSKPPATIEWE